MPNPYNPNQWYWAVAGNNSQVFSGASISYVALTDSTYESWLAGGNVPTKISAPDMAIITAQLAVDSGVELQSTGDPSLNGVYSIDDDSQAHLTSITTYILKNGVFPASLPEMPWLDMAGETHLFPDTTTFTNFATALANYATELTIYGLTSGQSGDLPSQPVIIP